LDAGQRKVGREGWDGEIAKDKEFIRDIFILPSFIWLGRSVTTIEMFVGNGRAANENSLDLPLEGIKVPQRSAEPMAIRLGKHHYFSLSWHCDNWT
jgi:hypothetical protein